MRRYEVIYLQDNEEQKAYVVAANKAKAHNAFVTKHPDVPEDAIESIEITHDKSFEKWRGEAAVCRR